jgi:monoamine oxidase
MRQWDHGISRRGFLSGLAVLGLTPIASRVAETFALPGPQKQKQWTGDNFEEAHEIMRNPYRFLRDPESWTKHEELHDVIIVGGGMAGLTSAYLLRDRSVLLLERDPQTGGVSKSENWNGIEYSIGAAYMIDPEPEEGGEPNPNFDLLVELGLRKKGENLDQTHNPERRWSHGKDNHCLFTNTLAFSEEEIYSTQNVEFFEHVSNEGPTPDIPPTDEKLVQALDSISYKQFLSDAKLQQEIWKKTLGPLSPRAREATEYYFWGAFGTNTWETSAYHGLNFFAAEFGNILVFPGGNAFIAKRLTERVRQHNAQTIRTGHYVLEVAPEPGNKVWNVLAYHENRVHSLRARAVIFSSPLFLAKRMVPHLSDEQRKAIESLDYRSFVVANVLLKRRLDQVFKEEKIRNGYELTRLHNLDVERQLPDVLNGQKIFSDICTADFASWRSTPYAVLTVYRPFPYASGRDRLRYLTYDYVEAEVRRAILEGLHQHGLEDAHIEDIRLTRWGHPMIIPRPGQMADGTLARARRSQPGLYFAHTDIQGAPAIENALASARAAVEEVQKQLG